ncbi:hypothetical protein FH608_009690 [Nonomuraea phyllanthi]|uniref:Uncharacterized protein n=1 Tax=Nonomuraea phyllanthi TaxID=2219224 RepID=A0A5C4WSD0_9ACTN|nr:sensor domain-containing protein [Nonomuraea phyllanthi]KAB8195771.1 hypothetical protein FH608_009690 [Nonomuraea phyllanthi]QFY07226.1 hypothetical protein GBF35_11485 [Nonomuraea phyllanthi]
MKREIIAGGLVACALVGCGGEETGSMLDAHAVAQLREALSKEPPLPDGFTARPEQAWRIPFTQGDENCRAVLAAVGGQAPWQALTAQAAVSYRGDGLGEQAGVGVARYADGEAEEHLDELADAMDSCRELRTPSGTDLRSHSLPVEGLADDVADEAVGTRLRGRLNGYPYAMDVVLTRVGDMLVSVVHTGMDHVDAARTREVVDAVVSMASA